MSLTSSQIKAYFEELGFNILLIKKVSTLPKDFYAFRDDQLDKTIVFIGSGGPLLWNKIPDKTKSDFLDKYSVEALSIFQEAEIIYPGTHCVFPLQKLSRHLNFSTPSPIGIDISKDFGLWFAFRGLALVQENLDELYPASAVDYCESCSSKNCLTPLDFNLARAACPEMSQMQYGPDQSAYHLQMMIKLTDAFQKTPSN